MNQPDRVLPSVNDEVEIAEFDDQLVVLMPSSRRAVHLDPAHALVLDSCRHGHRFSQLTTEMMSVLPKTDRGAIGEWIADVLQELARVGVTEPADAVITDVVADL